MRSLVELSMNKVYPWAWAVAQAGDEWVPSFLPTEEQYAVAHSLDEYVVSLKAEFVR
jgi:hypothetical protein